MKLRSILLPVIVFGFFSLIPLTGYAAETDFFGPIIPPECHCEGSAPDWGCAFEVLQNIINLAISLGVVIFVLVATYAGILWIASPVNPRGREQGRTILVNAVVGLLIALGAWLFVDFIMKALYRDPGQWGPWNNIIADGGLYCLQQTTQGVISGTDGVTGAPETPANEQPTGDNDGDGTVNSEDTDDDNDTVPDTSDNCDFDANPQQEDTDGDGRGNVCDSTPNGSTIGEGSCPITRSGLCFQTPAIANQYGHMSAAVRSVAQCIKNNVPEGRGHISSVSDSMLVSGSRTWQQCADGQCQHSANSCHYGGRTCVGSSYALDYGDGGRDAVAVSEVLEEAARSCGASINREGNHLHVSVGGSCGCDAGL